MNLFHRSNYDPASMYELLMKLIEAQATDRATLKGHVETCDKRTERADRTNDDRHKENTRRLDAQDEKLDKQNSFLQKLLWGVLSGAAAAIGSLLVLLIETALKVHQ